MLLRRLRCFALLLFCLCFANSCSFFTFRSCSLHLFHNLCALGWIFIPPDDLSGSCAKVLVAHALESAGLEQLNVSSDGLVASWRNFLLLLLTKLAALLRLLLLWFGTALLKSFAFFTSRFQSIQNLLALPRIFIPTHNLTGVCAEFFVAHLLCLVGTQSLDVCRQRVL